MLHVLNGDATLGLLRRSGLIGETLVWRDALLDGPARGGLWSAQDWAFRAERIAKEWGIARVDYERGVGAFLARFDRARSEDAVLWFEEDLFCQLPLCYLITRAAREGFEPFFVCPQKPLGLHEPGALRELFAARRRSGEVAPLARRAWDAYSQDSPRAVQALVDDEAAFEAWPLLRSGLQAHLARFPDARSGLSALEDAVLRPLLAEGLPFDALFAAAMEDARFAAYGVGDFQVALALRDLATGRAPLVTLGGPADAERMRAWRLDLTATGRDVLEGRADHAAINAPDRFVGGARVSGADPAWRFDAARGRLVTRDP